MMLALVFIFSALTLWALYRAVAPFLESSRDQLRFELLDEELGQIEELVSKKSVITQTLRDIEFDHNTGKLSDRDYERLRKKYERRALRVMRKLEELRGDTSIEEGIDAAVGERLEAAVQHGADAEAMSDPTEGEITCPDCGRALESDARFCSGCGVELDSETDAADDAGDPADAASPNDAPADGLQTRGESSDDTLGAGLRSEPAN